MKFSAVALPLWVAAVMAIPLNERQMLERASQCGDGSIGGLLEEYSAFAKPLCEMYADLPQATGEVAELVTSACACLSAATSSASASSIASVTSVSASLSIPTASANLTSAALVATSSSSTKTKTSKSKTTKTKTKKTKTKSSTASASAFVSSSANVTSIIATGAAPSSSIVSAAATSAANVTTSIASVSKSAASVSTSAASVSVTVPTSTTGASVSVSIAASCTVTEFSALAAATSACSAIMIKDVTVPAETTLDLTGIADGTTIVFSGTTTFEYAEVDYDMIEVSGTDIEITAEADAIIDGNGSAWWDGEGSNGGKTKPDHFFVVKDMAGSSSIHDLYIQNWPTHCFDITGSDGLSVYSITLNNTAGDAANSASDGDPAAHNSDGFDLSSTTNTILYDISVYNQDDCVAVTSGSNITISNFYCSGGHGLSIGSVGGKSNNDVENITFENSQIVNSQNGARIKSNYDTTGTISNIIYKNIVLSEISDYGIDIQQDYENGGATGTPSNGVTISGVTMTNITGTATSDAVNYYILCGSGSCTDFVFNDISITGGSDDSCNVTPTGDFSCA